jgi:hypothetical protein
MIARQTEQGCSMVSSTSMGPVNWLAFKPSNPSLTHLTFVDGPQHSRHGRGSHHVRAIRERRPCTESFVPRLPLLFDLAFDQEGMIQCAHLAGFHEEIKAMPMYLQQPDRGHGQLAVGGQKQAVDAHASTAANLLSGRAHYRSSYRHTNPPTGATILNN